MSCQQRDERGVFYWSGSFSGRPKTEINCSVKQVVFVFSELSE